MFERYTENARRTIFFARFEASQFGSAFIDTEHLLLGLLREDATVPARFFRSNASVESIREKIEARAPLSRQVSTSVDLPLSHQCKRVLAYGAEEAERLAHKHIGTEHLLLGLLREEECFASQILREHGLDLYSLREQVQEPRRPMAQRATPLLARLNRWLEERQALGGIRVASRTAGFAIYPADSASESEDPEPLEELARIHRRIERIVSEMDRAIANHDFEKARFYSDEERQERENLRSLREQFNLQELPPQVPPLVIEMIVDERFSDLQSRCDRYLAEGVSEVWLLSSELKRAYTVTKAEGLREAKILQSANPPLELDPGVLFN